MMTRAAAPRLFIVGLILAALAACDAAPIRSSAPGGKGFQAQYSAARDALEAKRYARAISGYQKLLPASGALSNRVRIELAHSHLRANQFADASRVAAQVATSASGQDRAAALAVQGTADHERALAALAAGDSAGGKALLERANTALSFVVADHPSLDPLGGLAGRKASIAVRLRGL